MTIAEKSRIGIATPHIFPDGRVDMDLVRRFVRRADALGYASLWTQERVTGRPTVLDPVTFLSYIAGQAARPRIGVSVFVLPRHNPIHLAKQMASLDQMSGGRLIVGVGLGAANDLAQYGIPAERRVRRFMEHVEILKALWTQTPVRYSGELYELDNVNIEPKPVQKPHPPLWFGANADPAIRRAVRYADGWTGAGSSPRDSFEERVAMVENVAIVGLGDGTRISFFDAANPNDPVILAAQNTALRDLTVTIPSDSGGGQPVLVRVDNVVIDLERVVLDGSISLAQTTGIFVTSEGSSGSSIKDSTLKNLERGLHSVNTNTNVTENLFENIRRDAVFIGFTEFKQGDSETPLLGDTADFTRAVGFITDWWLIGPFPNPQKSAYKRAFFPEGRVDLKGLGAVDGRTLIWKRTIVDAVPARIDLTEQFRPNTEVACYAYSTIDSPSARDIHLRIGTDDGCVVWLNGRRIHGTNAERGFLLDQDIVKARLEKGENELLVKVLQSGGGWEMCVRITDDLNRPLDLTAWK